MKDHLSLILIFVMALVADSEAWVMIPLVVAIALLQIDKIEKLLKQ